MSDINLTPPIGQVAFVLRPQDKFPTRNEFFNDFWHWWWIVRAKRLATIRRLPVDPD